jgi:hypothetical protein
MLQYSELGLVNDPKAILTLVPLKVIGKDPLKDIFIL